MDVYQWLIFEMHFYFVIKYILISLYLKMFPSTLKILAFYNILYLMEYLRKFYPILLVIIFNSILVVLHIKLMILLLSLYVLNLVAEWQYLALSQDLKIQCHFNFNVLVLCVKLIYLRMIFGFLVQNIITFYHKMIFIPF